MLHYIIIDNNHINSSLLFTAVALAVAVIFRGGVWPNDGEVKVVLQRERMWSDVLSVLRLSERTEDSQQSRLEFLEISLAWPGLD